MLNANNEETPLSRFANLKVQEMYVVFYIPLLIVLYRIVHAHADHHTNDRHKLHEYGYLLVVLFKQY